MRFPNESAEYRAARDGLLAQEAELRRATEAVAAARRALPAGGEVPQDYVFEGVDGETRLSQLFAPGQRSLALYSFMFPRHPSDDSPGPSSPELAHLPLAMTPCPSCTGLLDALDGAAQHADQLVSFAAVARAPLPQLEAFARERGWRHLRLLSSGESPYHRDYGAQDEDGNTMPLLNVFERDGETVRHFWASELFWGGADPGQDPRHLSTIEPLWNLLDLTREGRPGDFYERLSYSRI
jgi:predicted dithiol-disulfide oxidoreductase (DUF899 family)